MRDMELSLPLIVDDEADAFVERVGRERFKGRGKDDSAERRTIRESVFFDRFNSLSQSQLFESGAVGKGPLADGFNRTGNFDALERATLIEGAFFDSSNPRSQMKLLESGAFFEGFLADDFD